jgi:hypothetical protein
MVAIGKPLSVVLVLPRFCLVRYQESLYQSGFPFGSVLLAPCSQVGMGEVELQVSVVEGPLPSGFNGRK